MMLRRTFIKTVGAVLGYVACGGSIDGAWSDPRSLSLDEINEIARRVIWENGEEFIRMVWMADGPLAVMGQNLQPVSRVKVDQDQIVRHYDLDEIIEEDRKRLFKTQ